MLKTAQYEIIEAFKSNDKVLNKILEKMESFEDKQERLIVDVNVIKEHLGVEEKESLPAKIAEITSEREKLIEINEMGQKRFSDLQKSIAIMQNPYEIISVSSQSDEISDKSEPVKISKDQTANSTNGSEASTSKVSGVGKSTNPSPIQPKAVSNLLLLLQICPM